MKRILILTGIIVLFLAVAGYSSQEIRRYCMVVGANNGGAALIRLRYAVQDAESFADVLQDLGGIDDEDKLLLVEPTVSELVAEFDDLIESIEAANDDYARTEVFFYYSGHSDEKGLLLGNETLTYSDFRDLIETVPADAKVAVLDSCSSGMVTRTKGGTMVSPLMLDSSTSMEGTAYMTSSSYDEASQESDLIQGSFFTYYLVSGLRGAADANEDGKVTLTESYQYTFDETLAGTEQTIAGAQHPGFDIQMSGSGDVVLTDVRLTSAVMSFDSDLSGRLFIRDDNNKLVAEVSKEAGRAIDLGLEPGTYTVTLEDDLKYRQGSFTISMDDTQAIAKSDLKPVFGEITTSRGTFVITTTETTTSTSTITSNVVYSDMDLGDVEQEEKIELEGVEEVEEEIDEEIEDWKVWVDMDWNKDTWFSNLKSFVIKDDEKEDYVYFPVNISFVGDLAINYTPEDKKTINSVGFAMIVSDSEKLVGGAWGGIGYDVKEQMIGYVGGGIFSVIGPGYQNVGAQSAGIFTSCGGNLIGAQSAGIFNVIENNLVGAQTAGIFNKVGGELIGAQLAGIYNKVGFNVIGAQIAGIFNSADGQVTGAQIAGIWNYDKNNVVGAQIAGIFNSQDGDMIGMQIAGIFNNSTGYMNGAQISTVNIANTIQGGQLGLINIAKKMSGVQVGLVNISEEMNGIPIGLISISKDGYNHFTAWWEENDFYNVGVTWGTKYIYSTLAAGMNDQANRMKLSAGMGMHFPIGPFFINLEGLWGNIFKLDQTPEVNFMFDNIQNTQNPGADLLESNISSLLTVKLTLGLEIFKKLSIYGGISYNIYMPRDGQFDSEVVPTHEYVSDWVNDGYKSWPGFFIGVQL